MSRRVHWSAKSHQINPVPGAAELRLAGIGNACGSVTLQIFKLRPNDAQRHEGGDPTVLRSRTGP